MKKYSRAWWQAIVDLADYKRKYAVSFPAKARLTNIYYYAKIRLDKSE